MGLCGRRRTASGDFGHANTGADSREHDGIADQAGYSPIRTRFKPQAPWSTADPNSFSRRRGPFLAPQGTKLISRGKTVTSSDARPIIGTLRLLTDGVKDPFDGNWVELAPGKQWVQIDLGRPYNLYTVVVWHYYGEPRIYRDVVIQVADDPAFTLRLHTLFDNSVVAGPPAHKGKDRDYYETNEGKLIPGNGVKARYVRLYSNGNSSDDQNHYTEVEVWGKERPKPPAVVAEQTVLQVRLPLPHYPAPRWPRKPLIPRWSTVDPKTAGQHGAPFVAPKGVRLLSRRKPVTSSAPPPIIGSLSLITDGDKSALDGSWVELAPGKQWVQIDLLKPYDNNAVQLWHYHGEQRIYKAVVVQVADDPEFTANVRTLFDNTVTGDPDHPQYKDRQYFETSEGKLIPANGVKARYVRLYSNGNSSDDQNHYIEVEVWGQ